MQVTLEIDTSPQKSSEASEGPQSSAQASSTDKVVEDEGMANVNLPAGPTK